MRECFMKLDADSISNAVFQKEINMEKLIHEILFSLEEEEQKDGKPTCPKNPHKRDGFPKRNSFAFTDKNSLRSESHVAAEREKRI